MARPKLQIDEKQVELLASCFCTDEEISAKLGCSSDTLTRRFAESLKKGRDTAKGSLRVMQFTSAKKGNVTMQIWLGKQYLGQADKIENSGKDGGPIQISAIRAIQPKPRQIDSNSDEANP